jgi:hypothetical protein
MEVMKNIHVLPTEKPSRFHTWINDKGLRVTLYEQPQLDIKSAKNIYITSDEEIKEGDWCIGVAGTLIRVSKKALDSIKELRVKPNWKKVILTTDQDLIKDGVQAIDDEFLEWFVKNPSCVEVEVKPLLSNNGRAFFGYKIIIPEEEPKEEGYICPQTKLQCRDECCVSAEDCHIEAGFGIISDCEPPKQETLENLKNQLKKVIKEHPICVNEDTYWRGVKIGLETAIEVVKLQKQDKKMYSEEEVNNMFATLKINSVNNVATITNVDLFISSWKKQFKKK